jgi:PAS domain S-box-containing protein
MSPPHDLNEDALLRHLIQGTASKTGRSFFRSLVKHLSHALGTHGAWVSELNAESNRLRALAFWLADGYIEGYEYDLSGTPCENTIHEKAYLHIPQNVIELFPDDPDLAKLGAVSYIGFPLLDPDDKVLGNLAVIDTRPLPDSFRNLALFKIFAARATAELLRLRAEAEVRERQEKIDGLFRGTMDAIIELDENFNIFLLNPAAERLLGATSADIAGKPFAACLSDADMLKVRQVVGRLSRDTLAKSSVWLSGGLTIRDARGRSIPTEATLTLFRIGDLKYYALIVRDINERYESQKMIESLREETDYLRDQIQALYDWGHIVGNSEVFRKTLQLVTEVAPTDATVLISGETGTGKELIARAIHAASLRKHRPFIVVNCAAIPETLIESEFFGHAKGAFTGATQRREGRFALADGGTIFLDEVGELNKDVQAKLLRVIQEGEFSLVGSSTTRHVDVRVIAATNRDLSEAVQEGQFRTDLFFRLSVFPIAVPPLRKRGDDIAQLAEHLTRKISARLGRTIEPLTPDLLERLKSYEWPGNIRELQNIIERGIITARHGRLNLDPALPPKPFNTAFIPQAAAAGAGRPLKTALEIQQLERENLLLAMQTASWRVSGRRGAAHLLGIPPSTLQSKLKAYGIQRPRAISRDLGGGAHEKSRDARFR